jgi:hypothetical protein
VVEEAWAPGENHRPRASNWKTLSLAAESSAPFIVIYKAGHEPTIHGYTSLNLIIYVLVGRVIPDYNSHLVEGDQYLIEEIHCYAWSKHQYIYISTAIILTSSFNSVWSSFLFSLKINIIISVIFVPYSFSHGIVCPSSIYSFWLPLQYLQIFITPMVDLIFGA